MVQTVSGPGRFTQTRRSTGHRISALAPNWGSAGMTPQKFAHTVRGLSPLDEGGGPRLTDSVRSFRRVS